VRIACLGGGPGGPGGLLATRGVHWDDLLKAGYDLVIGADGANSSARARFPGVFGPSVVTDEPSWRAARLDGFDVSQPPGPSDEVTRTYLESSSPHRSTAARSPWQFAFHFFSQRGRPAGTRRRDPAG